MIMEPRVLRCQEIGLVIEVKRDRKWATIIARTSIKVFVKKVRNSVLDLCGRDFEYPQGIAQAAHRFLNPLTAVTVVTPEAQSILENIMSTYAINTSTNKVVGRFAHAKDAAEVAGENPAVKLVASASELAAALTGAQLAGVMTELTGKTVGKIKSKEKAAVVAFAAMEAKSVIAPVVKAKKVAVAKPTKVAAQPTSRVIKTYRVLPDADFTTRKGGFRLTLDAFANGATTALGAWDSVKATKPEYKLADIYSDISMARKYGYLEIEHRNA